jgi:hypothetical protein
MSGFDRRLPLFANPFVPAGGGSAVVCSVADCGASTFAAAGNGLYQIFLDRGPRRQLDTRRLRRCAVGGSRCEQRHVAGVVRDPELKSVRSSSCGFNAGGI